MNSTPQANGASSHRLFNSISLEQNIIAVSKIFDNITFAKMAKLLNTTSDIIEKTAAEMISQGKLNGSLDQAKSLIYFQKSEEVVGIDQQFLRACSEANSIQNLISEKYPQWYAQKFPEHVSH